MDLLLATARENPFGIPVLLVLIGLTLALFEHDRRMQEKHPVSGWGGTPVTLVAGTKAGG